MMVLFPTVISFASYPTKEKTKVFPSEDKFTWYFPLPSVDVPVAVPLINTFTPGIGCPVPLSTTVPDTFRCCAKENTELRTNKINRKTCLLL